jgi:trimethylamine---corrinoid protein Co-methyltransferase
MIPSLRPDVLTHAEIASIHGAMVRILSHTGIAVENVKLRELLAAYGAATCSDSERVLIPEAVVDGFLNEIHRTPGRERDPSLHCGVNLYQGQYLEPGSERIVPFTNHTLLSYVKLARLLDEVNAIGVLNYPLGLGRITEPLEARLFGWTHGIGASSSIQRSFLCPYILEMHELRAEETGRPLPDVFSGGVFMVSPLRLPRGEAEQLMFFHERGLRVWIASMITAGGSGPVTLAGSVALNLAEQIAIGMIMHVLYGDRDWSLGCMVAPLDLRSAMQPYGRPEMLLADLATLQLARHYGVPACVHTGLTDAKLPGNEVGMQKMLTALPCALAGGAGIEAGLLSIDEVFSPIQMILDAEMAGAIRRVIRGFEVNEETLAEEVIESVGPGGFFTATEHTAEWCRSEQWQPTCWSREMLQPWLSGSRRTDEDYAMEIWHELMGRPDFEPQVGEAYEERYRAIIRRAERRN